MKRKRRRTKKDNEEPPPPPPPPPPPVNNPYYQEWLHRQLPGISLLDKPPPPPPSLAKAISSLRKCSYEGCTNQVQKGGVCSSHKTCSHEGCKVLVSVDSPGGLCWRHGGKSYNYVPCNYEGCKKWGGQKGGLCIYHREKLKRAKRNQRAKNALMKDAQHVEECTTNPVGGADEPELNLEI